MNKAARATYLWQLYFSLYSVIILSSTAKLLENVSKIVLDDQNHKKTLRSRRNLLLRNKSLKNKQIKLLPAGV